MRTTVKIKDPDGSEREEVRYVKTKGKTGEDVLTAFRNSFNPRIAVTVDMIATGTDVKPVEIVFFMRSVRSGNYFEQMKGRGVRVISLMNSPRQPQLVRRQREPTQATKQDPFCDR